MSPRTRPPTRPRTRPLTRTRTRSPTVTRSRSRTRPRTRTRTRSRMRRLFKIMQNHNVSPKDKREPETEYLFDQVREPENDRRCHKKKHDLEIAHVRVRAPDLERVHDFDHERACTGGVSLYEILMASILSNDTWKLNLFAAMRMTMNMTTGSCAHET